MPKRRRFWLWSGLLGVAASALLVVAGVPLVHQHHLGAFAAIVVLATAAELLLVRYPLRPEYLDRGVWLSVSTPVVVATILAYGWQFGVWLDAVVSLTAGLFTMHLKSTRARWVFVNTAQSILSAAVAGFVALFLHPVPTSLVSLQSMGALVAGLSTYMLVNTLLVSITIAIAESARLSWVLRQTLLSIPRDVLLMIPISALIAVVLAAQGVFGLLGVLVPYLALRQAFVIWAHQQALYHQTIRSLGFLVQRAHPYTGGHLQRVARWARRVAERLGLPPERCELVYEAALLHDLGKTVLDERVLNKPARLTPEEWEQVKKHPQLGAEILSDTPFLSPIAPWVALHHERPDGKGYPFGLQGEQIPLEARLIAVVDAFDAMIGGEAPNQHRLHRRPLSIEEALAELERGSGTQFDPQVVQAFKQIVMEWQQRELHAEK